MPMREYRCESGHQFETFQRMSAEPLKQCPQRGEDGSTCMAPLETVIQQTQRPIVRGGTPTHHRTGI